jgi:hypothetical protein
MPTKLSQRGRPLSINKLGSYLLYRQPSICCACYHQRRQRYQLLHGQQYLLSRPSSQHQMPPIHHGAVICLRRKVQSCESIRRKLSVLVRRGYRPINLDQDLIWARHLHIDVLTRCSRIAPTSNFDCRSLLLRNINRSHVEDGATQKRTNLTDCVPRVYDFEKYAGSKDHEHMTLNRRPQLFPSNWHGVMTPLTAPVY